MLAMFVQQRSLMPVLKNGSGGAFYVIANEEGVLGKVTSQGDLVINS